MDKNQLRKDGLAFGRSFQRAFKTFFLYAPDHPAAEEPVQKAYAELSALLKQVPRFTLGFFNRRVVLNELVIADPTLEALDAELFKRGISALTFSLGITLRDFKRALQLLATKPETAETSGGVPALFQQNPVPHFQISLQDAEIPSLRERPAAQPLSADTMSALARGIALDWSATPSSSSASSLEYGATPEDPDLQVVARALQTARTHLQLLEQLERLSQSAELSPEAAQRVRHEIEWVGWDFEQRTHRLLSLETFSPQDYRHLLEHVQSSCQAGRTDQALQLASRFLSFVDSAPEETRAQAVGRLPELISALAGPGSLGFVRNLADQLCTDLVGHNPTPGPLHQALASALAAALRRLGALDDLPTVIAVGQKWESLLSRSSVSHAGCCEPAFESLLPSDVVRRLVEKLLQPPASQEDRADPALLKLVEIQAAEEVFKLLEEEKVASNRARLLHIARRLPRGSRKAATKRLQDSRWFVVRNACYVLGALADPSLGEEITPALRHPDPRVQEAAVTAITKSGLANRAAALAAALPVLPPHLQELALDDLLLLKDPAAIAPLEQFLVTGASGKLSLIEKTLQALLVIPDSSTVEALGRVLLNPATPREARKVVHTALRTLDSSAARHHLSEFSLTYPGDPLARP